MQFVASLTRDPGEIRRFQRLWKDGVDSRTPFRNVLVTALFTPPSTLRMLRQMKEEGEIERVYFDSGGFYVQMGRISYEDMYYQLLQFYRENDWADFYILPDTVPLSSDDESTRWHKVKETANGTRRFFDEMPSKLRDRALAVIQGRTEDQIDYCLKSHLLLGIKRLGFGSFATNGKQSSANILTDETLRLLKHATSVSLRTGASVHAFGVGTPPVIYLLNGAGVASFDSIGWMKTAGFGKVYLPFIRAYNITYNDQSARGMEQATFEELKELTGHRCAFCEDFTQLAMKRDYRALHNLVTIHDTIEMILSGEATAMLRLMDEYAPSYSRLRKTITDVH